MGTSVCRLSVNALVVCKFADAEVHRAADMDARRTTRFECSQRCYDVYKDFAAQRLFLKWVMHCFDFKQTREIWFPNSALGPCLDRQGVVHLHVKAGALHSVGPPQSTP